MDDVLDMDKTLDEIPPDKVDSIVEEHSNLGSSHGGAPNKYINLPNILENLKGVENDEKLYELKVADRSGHFDNIDRIQREPSIPGNLDFLEQRKSKSHFFDIRPRKKFHLDDPYKEIADKPIHQITESEEFHYSDPDQNNENKIEMTTERNKETETNKSLEAEKKEPNLRRGNYFLDF